MTTCEQCSNSRFECNRKYGRCILYRCDGLIDRERPICTAFTNKARWAKISRPVEVKQINMMGDMTDGL